MTQPSSINDELNNRLDELFDDGSAPSPPPTEEDAPLQGLNAAILEMEWEIGETTLGKYLEEISKLKPIMADDKAKEVYITLLETVGRYLMARKAKAHPDSIHFLKTLFEDFERVNAPEVSQTERNRSAKSQAAAFKQLKNRIASPGTGAPQQKSAKGEGISDEVKSYIRQVVREEIVRLLKNKKNQ